MITQPDVDRMERKLLDRFASTEDLIEMLQIYGALPQPLEDK